MTGKAGCFCFFPEWQRVFPGCAITSLVAPIDKLSILFTVAFSWLVLKEKLTPKAGVGLVLLTGGTLLLLLC